MALRTRGDFYQVGTRIDTTRIYPASRMVSTLTGLAVQRNKAIVGQNAFAHRVQQLAYKLSDEQLEQAFVKFKALADKKKEVFDEDIEALVDDQLELAHGLWELVGVQVTSGSNTIPTATVTLK